MKLELVTEPNVEKERMPRLTANDAMRKNITSSSAAIQLFDSLHAKPTRRNMTTHVVSKF
jgi:hypothetical protein